ncbi:MAG: AccI family restriction endonuclease [Pseudoxanthomonas sp.]
MPYLERIEVLKTRLEAIGSPARLDLAFIPSRAPTQAFSEFLTNKEQGDWAEQTFVINFNCSNESLWATKYGRSEDLIAGEPGFDEYYASYQDELATIGKRPDLLIFDRAFLAAQACGLAADISTLPPDELAVLVPQAKAAIEVRSSAFLSRKYEAATHEESRRLHAAISQACHRLLDEFAEVLVQFSPSWLDFCRRTIADNIGPAPRALARRSTAPLQAASALTGEIKQHLKQLEKRAFLSITPKAEDMSLVYRWLQRFEVPHYYCQVFFDRAVLMGFEDILRLIAQPERENVDYFIESDEKNQGKTTFKINIALGNEAMHDIRIPEHQSAMKELPKGRLLFYVRFSPSAAQFHPLEIADATH